MEKLVQVKVVSIWFVALMLAVTADAGEKEYYSKLDPKLRRLALAKSEVMKPLNSTTVQEEDDKNNLTDKIDIVKYLSEKCGFEYTRDANGLPQRPQVKCRYQPKSELDKFNGMTAKFDCKFTQIDENLAAKEKTRKVKYDPKKYDGGGHKEIPQAILGTQIARLLGFHTGTYCPVDLTCLDCPSENPWSQSNSSAPAVSGQTIEFKNVVVDAKMKGFKIEDPKNKTNQKLQGVSFRDLNKYYPKIDRATQLQMRDERDALTIWINFVVSQDADQHNNKLFCLKSKAVENANPECLRSAFVINDYGNSFGYTDSDTKLQISKFARSVVTRSGDQLSTIGASGNAGASYHPLSAEGVDLFVKHAEAITDQQLRDIFHLAQIDKVSDAGVTEWIQAFRRKVDKLK
jgi:hypothetical protein